MASESSHLLPGSSSSSSTTYDDLKPSVRHEIAILMKNSLPISLGYLLQNMLQLSSIIIIGRLGPLELSIAGSGFMIATCTGWLLAMGGTTALDALGSKAFTSKTNDIKLIGVYFQRCLFVTTLLFIPVALLWCFIGPLLVLCGQSYELAYGTQHFLRCLVPSGLGYIFFESSKKFLQCQNIQTPGAVVLMAVSIIHVPFCWSIVHVRHLGLTGGVFATGSMYWLAFFLIAAYIGFIDGKQAWPVPSKKMFTDTGPFTRLALLGMTMVGAEWWAFELIAVAAGVMGNLPIAAQSILMTTDTIFALIPFGIGVAATNRVGNLIGAEDIPRARIAARAASIVALGNGFLTMTILLTCRRQISKFFSNHTDVVDLATAVFPWGAAFQVVDSLQAVNSGCLRAMGRADIGAKVNIIAYYVFAIPIGLTTGFYFHWDLHGLWFGLALALAIVGFFECGLVNIVPWEKYVSLQDADVEVEEGPAV